MKVVFFLSLEWLCSLDWRNDHEKDILEDIANAGIMKRPIDHRRRLEKSFYCMFLSATLSNLFFFRYFFQ